MRNRNGKKDPVKKNMDKFHRPSTHQDKTKYNRKKQKQNIKIQEKQDKQKQETTEKTEQNRKTQKKKTEKTEHTRKNPGAPPPNP